MLRGWRSIGKAEPGREAAALFAAIRSVTRLPAPAVGQADPDRVLRYVAVAGAVGATFAALVWLAAAHVLPATAAAILAVGAWLAIARASGERAAAHLVDGCATPLGAPGALALGLAAALKIASLAVLGPAVGALAVVLAGATGAAMQVVAAAPRTSAGALAIAAALGTATLFALPLGQSGGAAMLVGAGIAWAAVRALRRWARGSEADTRPAIGLAGEIAVLLVLGAIHAGPPAT